MSELIEGWHRAYDGMEWWMWDGYPSVTHVTSDGAADT